MASAPFRAHVRQLLDRSDLPWPVVALASGVPPRLVGHLLFPNSRRRLRRLPRDLALRLLHLTEETLAQLRQNLVSAESTQEHLGALLAAGYPPPQLAAYCRLSVAELYAALATPRCSQLTALLARSARIQFTC